MEPPAGTSRLFAPAAPGESPAGAAKGPGTAGDLTGDPPDPSRDVHLLTRLLEDGDRADLAWLCATLPEPGLAAWLAHHGGRRLSRRSLAFWDLVLHGAAAPSAHRLAQLRVRSLFWPL
ncbi:MAG TPA: hypothetical protein VHR45_22685 [Thermoanaerobaculia bacterium]|nr:hypothetical protein [Thermoanaerobaculia bacterium]